MVVAELTVIPVECAEMRPSIDAAIDILKQRGLSYEVEAMGTTIEGDFDGVMDAVKDIHDTLLEQGNNRLIMELRIDESKAENLTLEKEVAGYR